MGDIISRQDAIDVLDIDVKLLRRILNNADIVGAERAKYEWGLGLIESHISDMRELPSVQPEIIRCKDCTWKQGSECVMFAEVRPFPDDFCSRAKRKPVVDHIEEMPSAPPELLTDKEQRIFLTAMGREEKVCEEVDAEWRRECGGLYKDSLVKVCHEITRKVKAALWET